MSSQLTIVSGFTWNIILLFRKTWLFLALKTIWESLLSVYEKPIEYFEVQLYFRFFWTAFQNSSAKNEKLPCCFFSIIMCIVLTNCCFLCYFEPFWISQVPVLGKKMWFKKSWKSTGNFLKNDKLKTFFVPEYSWLQGERN